MSNPKPQGVTKAKLSELELERLRRLRAMHGRDGAVELLRTSKHTLDTLLSGGGATPAAVERLSAEIARAS